MRAEPDPAPHRTKQAVAPLLIVGLLAAAAIGGAASAFRGRLATAPLIGGWFAAAVAQDHASDHVVPAAPFQDREPGLEARAPLTLDLRRQQLIGVRTASVERTDLTPTVRAVGTVRYDETRLADVNVKLEGWIRELYVDFTGQPIVKGQPLFTLYSPDLLATQQEYLLALKTRDQVRQSPIPDARESADRLVQSARQRLELWDLPPEALRALDETRQPQTTVVFRSPASGVVIEKQAVQGMHVAPGQTLYRVADLSRVWIEADLYEQEMPFIRVGRPAVVTLDAYPGERFTGRAVYVYPFVEERTRSLRVRFEFPNPNGRLRPGMFANIELQAPAGKGLTVPGNAVVDSGRRQVVFVALGDGYFEPRQVKIGRRLDDRVEILENLKEGEQVAIGATFFLDSESQLRGALESYQPLPAATGGPPAADRLDITFRTGTDRPKAGDNTFEVTVRDAEGRPVSDADVSVVFFMPAMPAMNMPAMRSEATLAGAGDGVYRGAGRIPGRGRWDVTVAVTRGGQRLGARQFAVTTD